MNIPEVIEKWKDREGGERAEAQLFLADVCEALGGVEPGTTDGVAEEDRSYFEYPAKFTHPGGTVGRIDFYKPTSFVLEAKQAGGGGIGKRQSPQWHNAMHDAHGQALGYIETLPRRPPFLIVCDVGYCFDLYASFDGSGLYRPFPDGRSFRHYLTQLEKHEERFWKIWHKPGSLDPSRQIVEITRDAAAKIANLARELRGDGRWSGERVAQFLIRAIFTMFAQNVELLPRDLFTRQLEHWVEVPGSLRAGLVHLWGVMRKGGIYGEGHRVRRFGGWLFHDLQALPLNAGQVELLLDAARHDWSKVEPAIFGTLLEQALDPKVRHARGAHFTPRAYVERLVRPTLEDPLRREWQLVRGQVRDEKPAAARRRLLAFHRRLTHLRVLDPACGSGNFLYLAFDSVKRLEVDVLSRLGEIEGRPQDRLELPGVTVTPEQFLGLEVDPWAGYLAELVLWIGYLQWQIRTLGGATTIQEPVLGEARSVVWRDALLDGDDLDPDTHGARLQVRRAPWPAADFIVGNPPFLGNKRMRAALGDPYVDALRRVYPEIPASADLCMFWWHRAAELLRQPRDAGGAERFGFITTNSITQPFNRRVVEQVLADDDPPLELQFAIPDHPWVDDDDGAAVRIAMTVVARVDGSGGRGSTEPPLLARLTDPNAVQPPDPAADPSVWDLVEGHPIHSDLTVGPDLTSVEPLAANAGLCAQGVKLVGDFDGAGLDRDIVNPATGAPVVRPLLSGRVLVQGPIDRWHERLVIDFAGLTEDEAAALHRDAFERLLLRVKPLRDENRRRSIRELWWRFGWERPVLRDALVGLERYIVTPSVAKHRLFVFLPTAVLPDGSLFAIASDDPFVLGALNSRPHRVWALAAGGRLGDANTPTWSRGDCFEPFPFPRPDSSVREAIGERALAVESHRQTRLGDEPGLHLTGLYNRLAEGDEPLLARLHERLDELVLDAYGFPDGLDDVDLLERLVEVQRTQAAIEGAQGNLLSIFPLREAPAPPEPAPWPRELPDRLAAVWQLLERLGGAGLTLEEVAKSFHGAQRKTVGRLLESLVGLGLVVRVERSPEKVAWLARRRLAV